jgi:CRISPR type IV-associated protein Csf2
MTTDQPQLQRVLINAYGDGEALSPLVHSEEVLSNRALVRRMSINSGGKIESVPVLSGNSFRGMWRDQTALYLIQALKVKQVSQDLFGLLFGGGSLSKGKVTKEFREKVYRLFPSLSLFGFSIGNVMYPSKVGVDFGIPAVAETQKYIASIYPKLKIDESDTPANDITNMTMMTLKKDEDKALVSDFELTDAPFPVERTQKASEEEEEEEVKRGKSQMIYHVEYIVPHTHFAHGFRSLYPVTSLELGALLKAISLAGNRSFGGMGGRGFGRMNWRYTIEVFDEPGKSDPAPKEFKIGNAASVATGLQTYLSDYDTYLNGLAEKIKADQELSPHLVME